MTTLKTMTAIALLPDVLKAAQLLAAVGVLREEDVNKCVRVYVKKNPCINEHLATLDKVHLAPDGQPF